MDSRWLFAALVAGAAVCVGLVMSPAPSAPSREGTLEAEVAEAGATESPAAPERPSVPQLLERSSDRPVGTALVVSVRDAETQLPLAGVELELWAELEAAPALAAWRPRIAWPTPVRATSDARGEAELAGGEDATATYFLRALGRASDGGWRAATEVVDGAAERVEIELRAARCERRRVECEDAARGELPPSFPALALSRQSSWSWRVWARREGADVLVVAPSELQFDALFALDDRRLARLDGFGGEHAADSPAPMRVRNARELRVRAVDEQGAPRAGVELWAIAEGALGVRIAARTDAGGEGRIGAFFGGEVELKRGAGTSTFAVGRFDLESDLGWHRIELPAPRAVSLVPRPVEALPAIERLRLEGAELLGEAEARAGAWRIEFLPAGKEASIRCELVAEGRVPCEIELEAPPLGSEPRIEIELEREAALAVSLRAPEDEEAQIELQKRGTNDGSWDPVGRRGARSRRGHDEEESSSARTDQLLRFESLRPGTYRLLDRASGAMTPELELLAGEVREVAFDLSGARWAHVRVAIPEGYRRDLLRLDALWGDSQAAPFARGVAGRCEVRTSEDGFRVRVPGDREVRVEAKHPRLIARGANARGVLRTGYEELELALDAGGELQFRVAADMQLQTLQVRARAAGSTDWRRVRVTGWRGGTYRAVGLDPGSYDLAFEPENALPLLMREFRVTAGEQDLGVLPLERGSALRVRVVDPGAAPDQSFVYAIELRELAEPAALGRDARRITSSYASGDEEEEIELAGIGPGTWQIEVLRRGRWSLEAAALECETRELAFDGKAERSIELVLRAAR